MSVKNRIKNFNKHGIYPFLRIFFLQKLSSPANNKYFLDSRMRDKTRIHVYIARHVSE